MPGIESTFDDLVRALESAGTEARGRSCRCPFHDDKNASGSLYDTGGHWRFKCHSCGVSGDAADIRALVSGRPLSEELRAQSGAEPARSPKPAPSPRVWATLDELAKALGAVAQYIFYDHHEAPVLCVLRLEPKSFRQARPVPGGWVCQGLPHGQTWPLYRMPQMLLDTVAPVVVCEGEKDCDALAEAGVLATTAPGGADAASVPPESPGKPGKVDWSAVAGRRVVLWPDDDEPGRKHAARIARELHKLTPRPEVCMIRDVDRQGAKDAAQLISEHGPEAARLAVANAEPVRFAAHAVPAPAPVPAAPGGGGDSVPWTSERAIAEALATTSDLRRSLRFLPSGADAGWRSWAGSHWQPCPERVPLALAAAVHEICARLMKAEKLHTQQARQLETTAAMAAIKCQLESYPQMRLDPSACDPVGLIATPSAILNLETGETITPDPDGPAFLRCTACDFDPTAEHWAWSAIAERVASQPLGDVLQRYLGASLIGRPADRKLVVLQGPAQDGKSSLVSAILATLGTAGGFAAIIPPGAVTGEDSGAHGAEQAAGLSGSRFAVSSEVEGHFDWSMLKAISGGDMRRTKRLYGKSFEYQPKCHLMITTNRDNVSAPDRAAADRLILVRWSRLEDADPEVRAATYEPVQQQFKAACLRWLVEGCQDFLANGYGVPTCAPEPDLDPGPLGTWAEDRKTAGRLIPGRGWASTGSLYADCAAWHRERRLDPPTPHAFGRFMRTVAQFRRAADADRTRGYQCTLTT